MATYRLLDGQSGRPGVGSSQTQPPGVTGYGGAFQAGTLFSVLGETMWLEGYWWWCPAGGDTGAQAFCLWQRTSASTQTLVTAATVTSGTLTAGAMNYTPLSTPVQIAAGTLYVAATGWEAVHGFPISNSQFNSTGPYTAGITNGPLTAWADGTAGSSYTYVAPTANWGLPQGVFGTGNSGGAADPTLNFPAGGSGSSLFWVDVQVSDTAPSGYPGSWRIWPNKFDAPGTGTDAAANYILGIEFTLSEACTLDNIWFYSPPGVSQLPTQCAIWDVASMSMVAGTLNTSPAWSGAAGSGWVSCAYTGVTLPAGDYKTSVWNGAASPSGFNEYTIDYFTTGYGQDGISSGPITVPNAATATSPGQGTYQTNASTFAYPDQYVATEGQSYWVDAEVTPQAAPPPAAPAVVYSMRMFP